MGGALSLLPNRKRTQWLHLRLASHDRGRPLKSKRKIGRVLAKERQRLLLAEIARAGRVVTSDFAARHAVSEVTVRTDLDELQRRGRVTRTYGGAVAAEVVVSAAAFDVRLAQQRDAKHRIAAAAAKYLSSNETVIFDAGTTVHHLAQVIPDVSGLTVYTPALPVAEHLMRTDGVEVHLLGGRLEPDWLQTVGTSRELGIKGVLAQTLFLGAQGIDDDLDAIDHPGELAATKQRLARHARHIVFMADGSKWSAFGRTKVMNLDRVDVVITDSDAPDDVLQRLGKLKLELVVV